MTDTTVPARPFGFTNLDDGSLEELLLTWLREPTQQEITMWTTSLTPARLAFVSALVDRMVATQFWEDGGDPHADNYPLERNPALGRIAERLLTLNGAIQARGEKLLGSWLAHRRHQRAFEDEIFRAHIDAVGGDLTQLSAPRPAPDYELVASFTTVGLITTDDFEQCKVVGCAVRCRRLDANGMCPEVLWDDRHYAHKRAISTNLQTDVQTR